MPTKAKTLAKKKPVAARTTTKKTNSKVVRSYSDSLDLKALSRIPLWVLVAIMIGLFSIVGAKIINDRGNSRAASLTIAPAQPGAVIYNSDAPSSYAHPGAMVDMNSAESPGAKAVSNAGGTVLVYVAMISTAEGGNYAGALRNYDSTCGPAIGTWPGNPPFMAGGTINNVANLVAPSSAPYGSKLKCVLERVVAQNPHMGGFFADDLGTTNGVGTSAYGGGCKIPTPEYYNAIVSAAKIMHEVAAEHNILFLANGGWDGRCGGGYPNKSQTGATIIDGYCIEHHPVVEGSYRWDTYVNSGQWATASTVTAGHPVHFVIDSDPAWRNVPNIAWISTQSTYASALAPWTSNFHSTGLPTHTNGTTSTPPPATTPPPTTTPTPTTTSACTNTAFTTVFPKIESESASCSGGVVVVVDSGASNGKAASLAAGQYNEYVFKAPAAGSYVAGVQIRGIGSYTLRLSDQSGATILRVATAQTAPSSYAYRTLPAVSLAAGQVIKLRVSSVSGSIVADYLKVAVPTVVTSACTNTAFATVFPRIEAESASCGSGAVATTDSLASEGKSVLLNAAGQFSEYVFKIPSAGSYLAGVQIRGTGSYTLRLSNQAGTVIYTVASNQTTPSAYTLKTLPATLFSAGQYVKVRVTTLSGTSNVDYLQLISQ